MAQDISGKSIVVPFVFFWLFVPYMDLSIGRGNLFIPGGLGLNLKQLSEGL